MPKWIDEGGKRCLQFSPPIIYVLIVLCSRFAYVSILKMQFACAPLIIHGDMNLLVRFKLISRRSNVRYSVLRCSNVWGTNLIVLNAASKDHLVGSREQDIIADCEPQTIGSIYQSHVMKHSRIPQKLCEQ